MQQVGTLRKPTPLWVIEERGKLSRFYDMTMNILRDLEDEIIK